MFFSSYIKCDICNVIMLDKRAQFDSSEDEWETCDNCLKAVKDAIEQRDYLRKLKDEEGG